MNKIQFFYLDLDNQNYLYQKEFQKYNWNKFLKYYPNSIEFNNLLNYFETGKYDLKKNNSITKLIEGILYLNGIILPKNKKRGIKFLLESNEYLANKILLGIYIKNNDYEMQYVIRNRLSKSTLFSLI